MRHKDHQDLSAASALTPGGGAERIRRASYYVWFLGAEECRGLRGNEVVRPVVQYLVGRERDHEPEKVTLQVSHRGIKLLQQQGSSGRVAAAAKHFIPASALTYVQQQPAPEDDIVSAVLLIYNPLTRCPVHLHVYRCDSTETAQLLRGHLQQLLQRPQQQAKLSALEARLSARGVLPGGGNSSNSRGSDGASTGSSISSSGGGSGNGGGRGPSGERMALLYDSLAAELREKLNVGTKGSPILLPPRDYDNPSSASGRPRAGAGGVGVSKRGRTSSGGNALEMSRKLHHQEDDSARSSGIGSDDAPSPTHDREFGPPEHHQSSSGNNN